MKTMNWCQGNVCFDEITGATIDSLSIVGPDALWITRATWDDRYERCHGSCWSSRWATRSWHPGSAESSWSSVLGDFFWRDSSCRDPNWLTPHALETPWVLWAVQGGCMPWCWELGGRAGSAPRCHERWSRHWMAVFLSSCNMPGTANCSTRASSGLCLLDSLLTYRILTAFRAGCECTRRLSSP